jgi:sugar O-acyltransferase (sialic acid O-acetyltransferase NeuD family)
MKKPLIIIGAGGHGKVVLDAAIKAGYNVAGFLDDTPGKDNVLGFRRVGTFSDVGKFIGSNVFVCAVGDNSVRSKFDSLYEAEWATVIHPTVQIALDAKIGCGTVAIAYSVVNASANVGRHCIINSGTVIGHDCIISDYSQISSNATICGGVRIGKGTWIGAGATVKNGISICEDVIVGAGAVVVRDITKKGTYIGVPAKLEEIY